MNESIIEGAALSWFSDLGYPVGQGPRLAPGGQAVERNQSAAEMGEFESFGEGVIIGVQQKGRLIQVRFDDKERLLMADMAPMRRLAG